MSSAAGSGCTGTTGMVVTNRSVVGEGPQKR